MLFNQFTDKTGIKVNVVSGKSKVLEKRILEEGEKKKQIFYFSQTLAHYILLNQRDYSPSLIKKGIILFQNLFGMITGLALQKEPESYFIIQTSHQ